jgi:hypothetical protein
LNDYREYWDEDAECAKVSNREKINLFFSNNNNDKFQAKLMCSECPVRRECAKEALEGKNFTVFGEEWTNEPLNAPYLSTGKGRRCVGSVFLNARGVMQSL